MKPGAVICVEDCLELHASDVVDKLREEIGLEEFLFYRSAYQEFDLFLTGHETPVWEIECTACGGRSYEKKDRKNPPKDWSRCPICGAKITPRRWDARKPLDEQQLSFQVFQPDGERMWLHSYQISRRRDASFDLFEYCRTVFYPGGARRWTRSRSYFYGVSNWEERRSVRLKLWHGCFGRTRENWFGRITMDEVRGTCVEYSQLDRALEAGLYDPVEYLALYCKYPACEYLWKMGLGWMFQERERWPAAFRRCVNLRAKNPKGLLKGLGKQDIKALAGCTDLKTLEAYRKLRERGIIRADADGVDYAAAVCRVPERVRELCFERPLLYKYFARQAKRSDMEYYNLLRDWNDYLGEIDEVGGGEMLPDNLREAHARLSARVRSKRTAKSNPAFRARRRLLARYCWRWNGMFIRPIDSETEIIREGELQNNCVAGYARRHAEGETAIFVLRRKDRPQEPWCTVEFKPGENKVIQCRTYRNGAAPPEAKEFIRRWLERNQNETKGRKTA